MRAWSTIGAAVVLLAWAGGAQAQTPGHTMPPTVAHTPTGQSTTGTLPGGVKQFKTEAEARSACGANEVTWANTRSYVLHDPGTQYFGKTSHGAYVCKGAALHAGYHEAGQKGGSKG